MATVGEKFQFLFLPHKLVLSSGKDRNSCTRNYVGRGCGAGYRTLASLNPTRVDEVNLLEKVASSGFILTIRQMH